jgi:hypothetical protein
MIILFFCFPLNGTEEIFNFEEGQNNIFLLFFNLQFNEIYRMQLYFNSHALIVV